MAEQSELFSFINRSTPSRKNLFNVKQNQSRVQSGVLGGLNAARDRLAVQRGQNKSKKLDVDEEEDEVIKTDNSDDFSHVKKVKLNLTTSPGTGMWENYKCDDELIDTEEYIMGLQPLMNPYQDSQRSQSQGRIWSGRPELTRRKTSRFGEESSKTAGPNSHKSPAPKILEEEELQAFDSSAAKPPNRCNNEKQLTTRFDPEVKILSAATSTPAEVPGVTQYIPAATAGTESGKSNKATHYGSQVPLKSKPGRSGSQRIIYRQNKSNPVFRAPRSKHFKESVAKEVNLQQMSASSLMMQLAKASLTKLKSQPKLTKQVLKNIETYFELEYDDLQRQKHQVMITEAGARLQAAKDKIYLCNDDDERDRVSLERLDEHIAQEANIWRMQVRMRRDTEVQRVEDRLNEEHKKNLQEAKERARLEAEFKWKNSKYSVRKSTVPMEMTKGISGKSEQRIQQIARSSQVLNSPLPPGAKSQRRTESRQRQANGQSVFVTKLGDTQNSFLRGSHRHLQGVLYTPQRSVQKNFMSKAGKSEASQLLQSNRSKMVQPSVIDEIDDHGMNAMGRLNRSDPKEAENIKRFHTARARKFQKAMPQNLLQAEQKLAALQDDDPLDRKKTGQRRTTLTYHSRNDGRQQLSTETRLEGVPRSSTIPNLLAKQQSTQQTAQQSSGNLAVMNEYDRINEQFERRFRGIDMVLKGNLHQQRHILDYQSSKPNGRSRTIATSDRLRQVMHKRKQQLSKQRQSIQKIMDATEMRSREATRFVNQVSQNEEK